MFVLMLMISCVGERQRQRQDVGELCLQGTELLAFDPCVQACEQNEETCVIDVDPGDGSLRITTQSTSSGNCDDACVPTLTSCGSVREFPNTSAYIHRTTTGIIGEVPDCDVFRGGSGQL